MNREAGAALPPTGPFRMPDRLDDAALRALLADAAEEGAKRALERVGLHDQDAAKDVLELRGVLGAWRSLKSEAGKTIVATTTKWLFIVILAGIAYKTGYLTGEGLR